MVTSRTASHEGPMTSWYTTGHDVILQLQTPGLVTGRARQILRFAGSFARMPYCTDADTYRCICPEWPRWSATIVRR